MDSARCGLLVLLLQFAASSSFAALGDSESAISKEAAVMKAAHVRIQKTNYSVHEISNAVGMLREYVAADGVVFAVTWRGMSRPDLSNVLGPYYAEYAVAAAKIPKAFGRHSTTVKSDHLTVQRGGHMRDIHGVAYVPDLLPSSVRVEDLQ
jgi:alkylhydroperoxidase family enzyme